MARIVLPALLAAIGFSVVLSGAGLVRSQPAPPAASDGLRGDQIELLVKTLEGSAAEGFEPAQFSLVEIKTRLASSDPTTHERGEALLQRSVVAYAKSQHGGRLRMAQFHDDWGIRPEPYDAASDFAFARKQDRLASWIDALVPPFERYRALRTALARYRVVAAGGGWEPIASGPPLKPGMTDPRVVQLRRRLTSPALSATCGPAA